MWCPACDTEYQPGMKTCLDCGAKLVDERARPETELAALLVIGDDVRAIRDDVRVLRWVVVTAAFLSLVGLAVALVLVD